MNSAIRTYVLDPLERSASTFVQQLVVVLLATGSASVLSVRTHWSAALVTAAYAAVLAILTTYASMALPDPPNHYVDLALRVAKTFLQSFVGVLAAAASTTFVSADWKNALATAVPVALLALLKGIAALALPDTQGASLLPAAPSEVIASVDDAPEPNPPGQPVVEGEGSAPPPPA